MKRLRTPSGLDVILEQMPTKTAAAVFTVLAGYGKESISEYGMAHLIEHMSFKGASPSDIDRTMRDLALCGAEWNASTSSHFVNYYLHCPSANIVRATSVLSDVFFRPSMVEDELEKEKKIVLAEMADTKDDPSSSFQEIAVEHHLHQALGHSCFGRKAALKRYSVDDLNVFRRKHYRSRNSILCVCGGFDMKEMEATAMGISSPKGWSSEAPEYVECSEWKQPACNKGMIMGRQGITQGSVSVLFGGPGVISAENPAYRVMLSVFGGGMFSLLFKRMRDDLAICYNVIAEDEAFLSNQDFSVASIDLSCAVSHMKKAKEEISVCAKMMMEGDFDEELLECAKQNRAGTICDISDNPLGAAFLYSARSLFGESDPSLESIAAAYMAVRKKDVVESAVRYLNPDSFRWSMMVPAQPQKKS